MAIFNKTTLPLATALAAALAAPNALAVYGEDFEFHGYMRSGVGWNNDGGDQVCFQLPGVRVKYRLGNECETYIETVFNANLFQAEEDGAYFRANFTFAFVPQGEQDFEQYSPAVREAWIEAGDVFGGGLEGTKFWAGKRFYRRHDVHINDWYFWDVSGPGAGIEDVSVGPGKLAYAIFHNINDDLFGNQIDAGQDDQFNITRHDLRYYDLEVNPGGSLTIGLDLRFGDDPDQRDVRNALQAERDQLQAALDGERDLEDVIDIDDLGDDVVTRVDVLNRISFIENFLDQDELETADDGYTLTLMHFQDGVMGGFNKIALQYGEGLGALDLGRVGATTPFVEDDASAWRIVEQLLVEPNPNFSTLFTATYEDDDVRGEWFSVGIRPKYYITDYFNIAVEAGYDRLDPESGGDERELWKFTIAPQISAGRGFWTRPLLRAFVTYADWNDAADDNGIAGGADGPFDGDTHGFSYGFQAEAWW